MFDIVENISENLKIQLIEKPEIRVDETWVEEVWNSALITRPWLVDDDIFTVCNIRNSTLHGYFTPYRYYVAQQEDSTQSLGSHIKPLAINSITKTSDDMTFLAKRGLDVYQDAGLWELAPCGGVTSRSLQNDGNINYGNTIQEELKEELGISENFIESKQFMCLIFDKFSNIYELIVKVSLKLTSVEALTCFSSRESLEYSDVIFAKHFSEVSNLNLGALSQFVLLQKF